LVFVEVARLLHYDEPRKTATIKKGDTRPMQDSVIRAFLPCMCDVETDVVASGPARGRYDRSVFRLMIAPAALFFAACAAAIEWPQAAWRFIGPSLNQLIAIAKVIDAPSISLHGLLPAGFIFFKNLLVVGMILAVGGTPALLPLAAIILGANGAGLGIAIDVLSRMGVPALVTVASFVPHGIIEIPALFLAIGISWRLRREPGGVRGRLRNGFRVLLPLLAAAAVIEVYLTPAVIGWAAAIAHIS